jgi:hypothetical protein
VGRAAAAALRRLHRVSARITVVVSNGSHRSSKRRSVVLRGSP